MTFEKNMVFVNWFTITKLQIVNRPLRGKPFRFDTFIKMTKSTASTATTIDDLATGHNTEDHVVNSPNREGKPGKEGKRPVTKAKLRSIMEAASALTALGDEEEAEADGGNQASRAKEDKEDGEDTLGKRYIPEHKKPDAALTFPEKVRLNVEFLILLIT